MSHFAPLEQAAVSVKLVFILAFFILFLGCSNDKITPKTDNLSFVNNDSIDYSIVMRSCTDCVPIRNEGFRVEVKLNTGQQKKIENLSTDEWMKFLNNTSTDWAANLILYDLYEKDAHLLSLDKDRKSWIKYLKKVDIAYWTKTLK